MDAQPVLTGIEVTDLLGQFDHIIKFDADSEFVIIHGPNGVGKTKLLELINAAFTLDLSYLQAAAFSSLRFSFADSTVLHIDRGEQMSLLPDQSADSDLAALNFRLNAPDGEVTSWSTGGEFNKAENTILRHYLTDIGYRHIGRNTWRDPRNPRRTLTTGEVLAKLPAQLVRKLGGGEAWTAEHSKYRIREISGASFRPHVRRTPDEPAHRHNLGGIAAVGHHALPERMAVLGKQDHQPDKSLGLPSSAVSYLWNVTCTAGSHALPVSFELTGAVGQPPRPCR